MTGREILYILTCGPLLLILAAWVKICWMRPRKWPNAFALLALGIVSANTTYAAGMFLYHEFRPPSHFLPPWQDPEILDLGLLFLLAPIGMVLGGVAAFVGAPKWLTFVLEIASLPLFIVGVMAGSAV